MASPREAGAFLTGLMTAGAKIFEPKPGFGEELLGFAIHAGIRGARIFDLQIAVMARSGGATEIWTADRQFVELPGLSVVNPFLADDRS